MLSVGDQAPDFSLPDQAGEMVSLSGSDARFTAVYFYPAASTPGCTVQACGVRDSLSDFSELGLRVLGISADQPEAVSQFAEEEGLSFPLLADSSHRVCEEYGVWSGRWASRTTFLVDSDLRVVRVFADVDPAAHADQLIAALGELD